MSPHLEDTRVQTLLTHRAAPAAVAAGLVLVLLVAWTGFRGQGRFVDERACASLWATPGLAEVAASAEVADPDPWWQQRWAGGTEVAGAAQRYQVAVRHDDAGAATVAAQELALACVDAGHVAELRADTAVDQVLTGTP